jgi:hypothetical protein
VLPFSKDTFVEEAKGLEELIGLRSLIEVDEHHKIGREIHVYQK